MRLAIIGLLTVVLCSCAEPNRLVGNWEYDHTRKSPGQNLDMAAEYNYLFFINDSLLDTKSNYKPAKYRLKKDSLFIYNVYEDQWHRYFVPEHTKDSLVLRDTVQEYVYKKIKFPADKPHQLSQIFLSTSGCFGRCPIMNISINSNGDVIYYGERFVDSIGYFTSKLPAGKFEEIEKHFGWANYDTLSQYYSKRITDSETIYTTLMKGDEIVNSVQDYAHSSGNIFLNWAYPELIYLPQQLTLTRLDSAKVPLHYSSGSMQFLKGKETWILKKSEAFLLWNYLRTADTVTTAIGPETYELKYWSDAGEGNVKTDGRLYQFKKGNETFTLDIGINFLTQNPKFVHFATAEE
jgi:hypothetical protein